VTGALRKLIPLMITLVATFGAQGLAPEAKSACSRIVFAATADLFSTPGTHIYTVNPDGTDLRELSHGDHDDILPTWSADGKQILYAEATDQMFDIPGISLTLPGYALYTMAADGSNPKAITGQAAFTPSTYYGSRLSWSADGRTILLQSQRTIMGGAGREAIQSLKAPFTDGELLMEEDTTFWPTFLPDGKHFGYVWQEDLGEHEFSNIYVSDLDVKVRTRITNFKDKYAQYDSLTIDFQTKWHIASIHAI
jgi:Tol biopolymer transport system component